MNFEAFAELMTASGRAKELEPRNLSLVYEHVNNFHASHSHLLHRSSFANSLLKRRSKSVRRRRKCDDMQTSLITC